MKLEINEIFGPTIQGEGPATGQHCLFVRLFRCNLECTWCDTPYTWAVTQPKADKLRLPILFDKAEQCHEMEVDDVIRKLDKLWPIVTSPTNIIISGGEPFMQQKALIPLLQDLRQMGNTIHIETAGTIMPSVAFLIQVDRFVCSPKLENSGNPRSKRYKPDVLKCLRDESADFKFVVSDLNDFIEIDAIVSQCNISSRRVMIMPEGVTVESQITGSRYLVEAAKERGYGLSLREHILIWGDKRGV